MSNRMLTRDGIDFARFLQERGLLSSQRASELREQAAQERIPLGQILVQQGALRVRQVMNVLEAQQAEPEMRFGELAVCLGYISTVTLEDALRYQRSFRLHQIQLARRDEFLSPSDLDMAVLGYVELLELSSVADRAA